MPVQTTYNDSPSVAFAGCLIGADHEIVPMRNEDAAEIGFGYGVVFDPSAPAHDQAATLPVAETNKAWGIVVHSQHYDRAYNLADGSVGGELGTTGLKPGAMMNVLRKGTIWARCEDGCAPGDRLWIRCTAGSPADVEFAGSLNSADEGTEMIDCTAQGVWLTTASAGGLAKLEVDFTNKP